MIDDTKVIMQYLEHLQEMFGAEIKVVTSGNIWIDFIAPGTNKGAALSNLMKFIPCKTKRMYGIRRSAELIWKCLSWSVTATQCQTVHLVYPTMRMK